MKIVITYDVFDSKRRRKVEKILSGYGNRVNLSVFEVELSKSDLKKIERKLQKVASCEDNIRFYILDEDAIKKSFVLNSKEKVFDAKALYF